MLKSTPGGNCFETLELDFELALPAKDVNELGNVIILMQYNDEVTIRPKGSGRAKNMKILCISASNVERAKEHSASTRACELVVEIAQVLRPGEIEAQVAPLLDYDMKPCRMCGKCLELGECARDAAFNQIYRQMIDSEAVFLVCPHYAPIPSKVMIITEKLEEMAYLNWCADPNYQFPLKDKPIGIIAHGGQTEAALPYYKKAILDPLAGAFGSVGMRVIGVDEKWNNGITFGVRNLWKPDDSVFVNIEHDWETVRKSIMPLVKEVIQF